MASPTKSIVAAAVMAALQLAAMDPRNTLQPVDVVKTAQQVTEDVAPLVESATNTEANWWEKRSVWSTIISGGLVVLAPVLLRYGIEVDEQTKEWLITSSVAIGGLWAGYLSWRAGRPGIRPLGK